MLSTLPFAGKKKRPSESRSLKRLFLGRHPSQSRFAESYRTLRTSIQFSFMEREFRSLLVTSAAEQEGKSTTAANLAYTMAQGGKRVLLVDADLRKPVLHQLVPKQATAGLTGLLSESFGTPVESGKLDRSGVSDLYRLIQFQRRTGALHLSDENEKIDLLFRNGQLADVSWLTRPKEKMLATLLVKNGVVSPEGAREALARKENTGQKLGFVLISMGLVKSEELAGYITLHMIEGLRTALQLKSGAYRFEKLGQGRFERASFDPADLGKLYDQVIIGEERLPFLQREIDNAIVRSEHENLFVLPAGSRPPKPAELLGSNRMAFLVGYLSRRFDVLVFDSPPLLPASDALLLAPQVDGVALVVKAGQTNRDAIRKATDQLRNAKANLLGVLLNQVDSRREGYYSYYTSYYGAQS